MTESEKSPRRDKEGHDSNAEMASISSLIDDLTCDDVPACQKARRALVDIGKPAIGPLIKALSDRREWVRWEATKALGQIGDPVATQVLVGALQDKLFDVRWLAAEGLIALGRTVLVPLLQALTEHPDSLRLRQGAHHILHDLRAEDLKEMLQPLLAALEDVKPAEEVPLAAKTILDTLTGAK